MVNLPIHEAAHVVLQTMSSESTPVLCGAIATFELLMTSWERLAAVYPQVKRWTDIGLFWARKYYKRMDHTNAYIVTLGMYPIYLGRVTVAELHDINS